jgi:hypothetical protein
MIRKLLQVLMVAVALGSSGTTGSAEAKPDAAAAFTMLKTLQGTWTAAPGTGRQSTVRFELAGNGTVLMEHYANPALPGGGHMVTAYHLDGTDLLLTHYCIANNQPTLRADRFDAGTAEVQFEFVRATNLATPASGHMRRAKYRILNKDAFVTEWEFFEKGALKMTETESFTRVK